MPKVECLECGSVQTISIFEDPECDECGNADFESVDADAT